MRHTQAIDRGVDEVEAVEVAVLSRRLARDAHEAFPQVRLHIGIKEYYSYFARHTTYTGIECYNSPIHG